MVPKWEHVLLARLEVEAEGGNPLQVSTVGSSSLQKEPRNHCNRLQGGNTTAHMQFSKKWGFSHTHPQYLVAPVNYAELGTIVKQICRFSKDYSKQKVQSISEPPLMPWSFRRSRGGFEKSEVSFGFRA